MRRGSVEQERFSGRVVSEGIWAVFSDQSEVFRGREEDLSFWRERATSSPGIINHLSPKLSSKANYILLCLSALEHTEVKSLFPAILGIIPRPSTVFMDERVVASIRQRFIEYMRLNSPELHSRQSSTEPESESQDPTETISKSLDSAETGSESQDSASDDSSSR